jgi:DNA-binding HxlR family transcriptional regulator
MAGYGQFCPVAKATEIFGEKRTVLVLRELSLGTTRFNDFQRAISRMSPTLLTKRLRRLEACGIVIRKKLSGQKGYEYRLTAAGKETRAAQELVAGRRRLRVVSCPGTKSWTKTRAWSLSSSPMKAIALPSGNQRLRP